MLNHYYTLLALCREFNPVLRGAAISGVFTQQKDELQIVFDEGRCTLCVSVAPKHNYCFVRQGYSRAKRNSVSLFAAATRTHIHSVAMAEHDRVIVVRSEEGVFWYLRLYNTATGNILLTDRKGLVIDSFKRKKELAGTPAPDFFSPESVAPDRTLAGLMCPEWQELTAQTVVKKLFPLFGSVWTGETLHRAGIQSGAMMRELSDEQCRGVLNSAGELLQEAARPLPVIYSGDGISVLSVVPLYHLAACDSESFSSVNEAVQAFLSRSKRIEPWLQNKEKLVEKLSLVRRQTSKTLEQKSAQSRERERTSEYEHMADTIMANLSVMTKGSSVIGLPDVHDPETVLTIRLNPKLSPAQNAEVLYERIKKIRTAGKEAALWIEEAKKKLSTIETLLAGAEQCESAAELDRFRIENDRALREWNIVSSKQSEVNLPFRVFTVFGGFEVLVGKNSSSNDELTTTVAKPNDWWFHARGVGGSHTVLRVSGKIQPPKEAILQAAKIAAYYSKMRNGSMVPVSYCQRKYVRKRKGSPEGTVTLEREEVVFVEPALP